MLIILTCFFSSLIMNRYSFSFRTVDHQPNGFIITKTNAQFKISSIK
jgi:hypothetical protein